MPVNLCRLDRPAELSAQSWAAIVAAEQRLGRAEALGDRPLIVGSAKELVETVAKAIVTARVGTPGANIDFGSLVTEAHKALDRQPGEGLASDGATRQLAQATKQLATALGLLRNDVGTGHGKATLPAVYDESLELAVTGGVLWSRWALRRLAHLLAGALEPLIEDLQSSTFRAGLLSERLRSAGLSGLEEGDARRLGVAVGQRGASGTFVVFGDGVRACADSDDVQAWPPAYREGVAIGLLLDRDGYLVHDPVLASTLVALLDVVPDPAGSLTRVVAALRDAPLLPKLHRDPASRASIVSAMDEADRALPQSAREPWRELRLRFDEPGIPT